MAKFIRISHLHLMILIAILLIHPVFAASNCTDSDNGQNFFEKGTMTDSDSGYTYSDYCSSDKLVEFYCDPGYHFIYKNCSEYSMVCEDGACINMTAPPPTTDNCADSDGGQNFDNKGVVVDRTNRTEIDYCTSSSQLVEWYCSSNNLVEYVYQTCSCENGMCVELQECIDSDDGVDYYTKGTTTGLAYMRIIDPTGDYPPNTGVSLTDYCTSSTFLRDYFCNEAKKVTFYAYECPNGCQEGVCITPSNKCSDGTSYGECSSTKPKYCDNGNLINNCQVCGCLSGQTCETNGSCTSPPSEVVCTDSSILGDANNDGKVTYDDYITVFNIYAGSIQPPSNLCCVDLDKDGEITREDSQLTYDIYVGKINLGRCNIAGCVVGDPCTTSENCLGKYDVGCNCIDIPNDNCPAIVNDTTHPIISDVSITPEVGPPGTIFTINSRVEDESALQYVVTPIYILNDYQNSIQLNMYDDGQHNDEQADDGIYGAVWDSTGYQTGVYGYAVSTRDFYNNDASTTLHYFLIAETTDLCKEVIPGHNNLNEPRANIVFVGINYPDKEFFKTIVEESVDYEGNKQGLLFLEPLKSNKDKFNFWYVDETKDLGHNHWDDISASNSERIRLSFMCPLSNKYVIAYYNTFFRPQAFYKAHAEISFLDVDCSFRQYCDNGDLDQDGCVSGQDYLNYMDMTLAQNFEDKSVPDINEDGNINGDDLEVSYLCQVYRVGCSNEYPDCLRRDIFDDYKTYTPHEVGHLFGGLLDEYVEEGVAPYSISYNGNCFQGTKQECLSNLNDKWYDLLGYGCGDNNKIDCAQEPNCQYDANEDGKVTIEDRDVVYNMYTGQIPMKNCTSGGQEYIIGDVDNDDILEYEDYIKVSNVGSLGVVCDDPNDPGCYLEVGCFEGCNYQATGWFRNTVSNLMRNNFVGPEYFSYGPVNERIICEEIKSITGSATGICSTKYNTG